jgi:hypothetical protein
MKFKITLLIALTVLVSKMGLGQTTIFTETIGTCCASTNTTIALTTFNNSGFTFTGTTDTRTSTPSTAYSGASGSRNVFFTNTVGRDFIISGINTTGYTSLTLSLGHYKSTTASNNELAIEVSSDGTNWTALSYSRATGTGTASWTLITPTGTIPSTANLRIRFRQTSATPQFRVDDIKLVGTATATPTISSSGILSAVNTTYGTASASPTSFSVSGANMTAGILVTPPAGFEVSLSAGSGFGTSITVGAAGTIASTPVYVRLAATTVPGTYTGNIVLSSSGASDVTIATVSSVVSKKELTISGLTGMNKEYDATTSASSTGTPSLVGIVGSDVVSISGTPSLAFANATVGTGKTITVTGYTLSGANATNYTLTQPALTADITPKSLTITATNVNKAFGNTLTGAAGSTAFSSSGLVGGQTIGSVTIGYGAGAAASDAAGTYSGSVTPSLATGGTFSAGNYTITYISGDILVSASPTLNAVLLNTVLTSTYGGSLAVSGSFSAEGTNLGGPITATAQTGFEVSTDNSTFSSSVSVTSGTTVYVRFTAVQNAGTYDLTVAVELTYSGATNASITTSASGNVVSQKSLSISGLTGANKEYDGTTAATFTGTASYVGLVNGETFSVSGTPSATFTSAGVGTSKPITVAGYTAPSANYTLTQPTLSADITAKALTVSGASAANKPYDGTTTASILGGSLVGVISPDVVTLTQAGNFVSANVGSGISVTSNFSISGTDAGNYTLLQPTGLSADITQASQTITFGALANQTVGAADYAPGATASSGLTVSYTSSNTAVATIVGGLIHVVGAGTTTITASQAGNGTYLAASDMNQNLTVSNLPLAAWEVSGLVGGANNFGPNPLDTISANANVLITKLTRGAGIIITSGTAAASAWGGTGVNSTSFANAVSGNDFITFGVKAKPGYTATFSAIPAYNIRRSGTGATSGQWQYQLNSGSFVDIGSPITWGTTTTGAGNLQSSIDLSSITALQEVPSSINVTFRLVVWGGTASGGTWYINNISGNDLQVTGIISDYVSPLPVEFLEFTATCNETNATDLKWSTASEHNSDYFNVEKSTDGINWSMLAKVAAAGNATERMDYSFEDTEKTRGAYYKLWQFDVDGTANLLATVKENCFGSISSMEPIVYPNPITDQEVTIELRNDKVDFITVQIYSMQGTLVYAKNVKATEQITLSKLNINPGIYQLIIQPDAYEAKSVKICIK